MDRALTDKGSPTDVQLVQRTLDGDRASFDLLVERYRDHVFRLAYFRVGQRDEAEDLAQEAFVSAYRSLQQLRDHDRFAPWLRRVAENTCNMWFRSHAVNTVPLEEHHAVISDSDAGERWFLNSRIREALSKLSETNQLAAVLYLVDGLSHKEIAEFLDVPIGTIKRRINLSRKQLKKELIDLMKDVIGPEKPAAEFTSRVASRIDVLRWYRRFAEYIDAGQSLVVSLAKLAESDFTDDIREETLAIKSAIEQGETLSKALKTRGGVLKHSVVEGMIRSGEVGGILHESCRMIVAWMERDDMSLRVDAAYWLRMLSFILTAGVPVMQAVDEMERVSPSESLRQVLKTLRKQLLIGGSISDALTEFPEVFSPAVLALVRAGEKVRMLDLALAQASAEIIREAYEQMRSDPLLAASGSSKPTIVDGLRSQLTSASPNVRIGALQALERLSADQAMDAYVGALSDTDAEIRETAASILSRIPSGQAVDALSAACSDPSPRVREAALVALAAAEQETALPLAGAAVIDSATAVRRAAVRVLSESPSRETAELLAQALSDAELVVSSPATQALISFGRDGLPPVLEILEKPADAPAGAWTVVEKVDPSLARDTARRLLSEGAAEARQQALMMLSHVAEPEDAPVLIEALREKNLCLVRDSIAALTDLKATTAVPGLIGLLDCSEWWIAARAANALGAIGDDAAAPALAQRMAVGQDNGLIWAAMDALAALNAKEFAGQVTEAALTFRFNGAAAAALAGELEAARMVAALRDPKSREVALRFLQALGLTSAEWFRARGRTRAGALRLTAKTEAPAALIAAIGAEERRQVRGNAIDVLLILVGKQKATRLLKKAAEEQELSPEIAEEAIQLVENRGRSDS